MGIEKIYEDYNEFDEHEVIKLLKDDAKFAKDEGDDQKLPPKHIIPLVLYDNLDFMNWWFSAEGKIFCRLFRHVVRGRMKSLVNKKLYRDYYSKGMLVAYREELEIAKFFGHSTNGSVNRALKSMLDKGIIKVHLDSWGSRSRNIYEFGTHDMSTHRHETLHYETIFTKSWAEKKLQDVLVS